MKNTTGQCRQQPGSDWS